MTNLFFKPMGSGSPIIRIVCMIACVTAMVLMGRTMCGAHVTQTQTVTLQVKNARIQTVFHQIEEQTGKIFVYKPEDLEGLKRISIKLEEVELDLILRELESITSLKFKMVGDMIGVARRKISLQNRMTSNGGTGSEGDATSTSATVNISGTVTDEGGEPLIGVNVTVEGTTKGTATDIEGGFALMDVEEDAVLVVSYIGYKTQRVPVNGRTTFAIMLEEDTQTLDEVVVIGYGTQKKSSLTGSIAKIENKTLDQMPSGRVENALAGKLAGVSIVNNRSTPGSAPLIRIRGAGSIDAGNSPLVVIDGFPGGDLGQLNMNDVESIEVLKDASAAAIYGSRAAGGVILVTTRRGDGNARLSVNTYYGISSPMLHDDWLTGKEWYDYLVKYQNREFAWAGGDISLPMFGDNRRPVTYQVNPLTYELPQTIWRPLPTLMWL